MPRRPSKLINTQDEKLAGENSWKLCFSYPPPGRLILLGDDDSFGRPTFISMKGHSPKCLYKSAVLPINYNLLRPVVMYELYFLLENSASRCIIIWAQYLHICTVFTLNYVTMNGQITILLEIFSHIFILNLFYIENFSHIFSLNLFILLEFFSYV